MYLFILGILTAQLTYIMVQWLHLRYREYLLYGAYIATFIIYTVILYRYVLFPGVIDMSTLDWLDNFKRPIAFILYYLYFAFGERFISMKERFPALYKKVQPIKKAILGFAVIQSILQIAEIHYTLLGHSLYFAFCIYLFVTVIIFIVKLSHIHETLINYLIWASISISLGAFLTNLINISGFLGWISESDMEIYFFLPSLLGAFFEIYFFNTGIAYKVSSAEKKLINRQQELIHQLSENEKKLIEQQRIRNKLAQDLHDDIGATLSGIALHSHMIKQQILYNKGDAVINSVNVIESGAVEMVNTLNDVVWTVNPKNDTIEELIERLKEYSFNMTQARSINLAWKVEESNMKELKLPMDHRRNIYLICKEAVNNAVKYSHCSELTITGSIHGSFLGFRIHDNGKGFCPEKVPRGNGLKNMQERANDSQILMKLESCENEGTTIALEYEFTQ